MYFDKTKRELQGNLQANLRIYEPIMLLAELMLRRPAVVVEAVGGGPH